MAKNRVFISYDYDKDKVSKDRLLAWDAGNRLLDGVEREQRAPQRAGMLQCGRRVVDRAGLDGHELLFELGGLPGFPRRPATEVALFADDAQEVT